MTKQDWMISIESAIALLYKAGRTADVEHVLRIFGHGAKCVDDLAVCDLDAVYGELHQRLADLDD